MKKHYISTSRKFSVGAIIIMLIVLAISSITTSVFFARYCLQNFYDTAGAELYAFSDAINMFFGAKEVELNVFSESRRDRVMTNRRHVQEFLEREGINDELNISSSEISSEFARKEFSI